MIYAGKPNSAGMTMVAYVDGHVAEVNAEGRAALELQIESLSLPLPTTAGAP